MSPRQKQVKCAKCSKIFLTKSFKPRFCSGECHRRYVRDEFIAAWLAGKVDGGKAQGAAVSNYVRNYILEEANFSCEKCGFNTPHPVDGKSILQIDHIDGDSGNNSRINLRAICPNCHALTPTFCGRNKGKGGARRKYRAKLRYIAE